MEVTMEAITGTRFAWLNWIPTLYSAANVVRSGFGLLSTAYQVSSSENKETAIPSAAEAVHTATQTSFGRTLRRAGSYVSEMASQGKSAAVGAAAGVAAEAAVRAATKSETVASSFFGMSSWTKWGLIAAAGLGALYAWRRYWNGDGAGNHLTNTVNINVNITGMCSTTPPQVETRKENGVTKVDIKMREKPRLREVVERAMEASKTVSAA